MKKTNIKNYAGAIAALAFGLIAANANGQKLPTVQKAGLLAPATVKVDGKATEWDDTFQAYNKSTDVYYSIANTAENLYLVVQATDPDIINKILVGGITFSIKNADKKSTADAVTITYPVKAKPAPRTGAAPGAPGMPAQIKVMDVAGGGGGRGSGSVGSGGNSSGGGIAAKLKDEGPLSDDDLIALNKQVTDNIKEIRLTGVKEFPDSSVSVYNDQGIQAAGLINKKKAYTCEFAIPIKYLQTVIGVAGTFNYNLMLNGRDMKAMTIVINGKSADAGSPEVANMMSRLPPSFQNMTTPTDFSGSYTLVKQ